MRLSLAREGDDFLLRFPGIADFSISSKGLEIGCYPHPGTDWATVRHLLLDQVTPMVLGEQGKLVLHAWAIAIGSGAIVCLGKTGMGKSTLSAGFCRQGFPLLTDDCLLLEREGQGFRVIPSYPGLRLWPDTKAALAWNALDSAPVSHSSEKERIKLGSARLPFDTAPVPVDRLYVIAPPKEGVGSGQVHICRIGPRDAFLELVESSFRLDNTDHNGNRTAFERIDEAISSLDVFRLSFPRDISFLPAVQTAVLEHMVAKH